MGEWSMTRPRKLTVSVVVAIGLGLLAASVAAQSRDRGPVVRSRSDVAPVRCRIRGSSAPVVGVAVDSQDHVWIVHRPGTLQPNETRSMWRAAPPVIELDVEGNVVSSWGGPGEGYEWP